MAQALSNRGRRGRKRDFPDAERLVKRLVARELTLSFVPDTEQRLWRTVTRKKYQLRCDRIRLQNQLESLLEEAHIKLSSLVSDLLGLSARRMLKALAEGETNPATLAALADERLRATPEQLCDALGACTELNAVYRRPPATKGVDDVSGVGMHWEFLAGLEDNSDDSDLVIVEQHRTIHRRDFHHVLSPQWHRALARSTRARGALGRAAGLFCFWVILIKVWSARKKCGSSLRTPPSPNDSRLQWLNSA